MFLFSTGRDQTIELLKNNPHRFTKMANRLYWFYLIKKNELIHYIPPYYKDSNFFIDLHTIIFPRESKLPGHFEIM